MVYKETRRNLLPNSQSQCHMSREEVSHGNREEKTLMVVELTWTEHLLHKTDGLHVFGLVCRLQGWHIETTKGEIFGPSLKSTRQVM